MEYWNKFYEKNFNFTFENSSFSEWCLSKLDNNQHKLIDIGCGNGRDLKYFEEKGIDSTGIDKSYEVIKKLKNLGHNAINNCLTKFDYKSYNILYCRFVIHTLDSENLNLFFDTISKSKKETILFIESRVSEDDFDNIINFKSVVGERHIRYIHSEKTILELITNSGFEIIDKIKSKGLSVFESEDPLIIRIMAIKKNHSI
jgi:SAM-dependent methyltransferase